MRDTSLAKDSVYPIACQYDDSLDCGPVSFVCDGGLLGIECIGELTLHVALLIADHNCLFVSAIYAHYTIIGMSLIIFRFI